MSIQKTVFISYRRTNMYMARAVYQNLMTAGYDAYLDVERGEGGDFSQALREQIAYRAHFVLILTPSALERCKNPGDWLRLEIEYAIEHQRNIVPLLFENFDFGEVGHFLVSEPLQRLPSYNSIIVPDTYFEEAMTRLRSNRFLDRSLEMIHHPVPRPPRPVGDLPEPTLQQREAERLFESGFRKSRLQSDYDGAIQDFDKALELKPDYAEAYYRRGSAWFNKDNTTAAIRDWKTAVRLAPDDPRTHMIRSVIASVEGDLDLALAEAEAGVRRNPGLDEALFQRAYARHDKKDYKGAIADYTEVLRLDPQDAESYNNRGLVYAELKDYETAIADYTEAIRLFPRDPVAHYNRGYAYLDSGRYEEATLNFEAAIRLDIDYTNAREALVMTQQLRQDKK